MPGLALGCKLGASGPERTIERASERHASQEQSAENRQSCTEPNSDPKTKDRKTFPRLSKISTPSRAMEEGE